MMTSPGDSNSAKYGYRRAILVSAAIAVSIASGLAATNADAKQKKHQSLDGATAAAAANPTASNPAKAPSASPDAAKTEAQGAKKLPEAWTDAEIADAKAHCAVILKRIHAVALPHAPIREGACGAPAPVELISIGQNPEVALSPPAIVRCDLAEQLANWFENDVQPLARKHLKSEIIRIETMSSYECRNAYGRKSTKLSEHGLANAIDIGGFVTESAKTTEVLDDWGKPEREILAEAATQKQAAQDAAAKTAEAGVAGNPAQSALPPALSSTAGAAVAGLARATIIEGLPKPSVVATAAPLGDPNHLGGPAAQGAKTNWLARKAAFGAPHTTDNPDSEMRAFLHETHDAACRIFGTTLGPEANADHRNHFHIDMAPRAFTKICD